MKLEYKDNIDLIELDDEVVEVDTTPEKIVWKGESITDTLYMRAQEQRDMKIESQYYTERG